MKLVTFESKGAASYGIWREDGVVDLGRRLGARFATLDALIAENGLVEAAASADAPPDHVPGAVLLKRPLSHFRKCFCVGVNYPDRNAEYKDASDLPKYPSLFVRFPESFAGPDEALLRPPESSQLDYEGEIVLVIGRAGRRIRAEDWRDHVMGYTLANEGTLRDWVRHGKFNVTPGKNWASSGALGPWIVAAEEVDPERLRVVTRVNGEVRQDDTTERLMFPFGRILEYISTFCTLEPGDIVLTGTPTGSGARFDPPHYLAPGDTVEVTVEGIGTLRNTVRDESLARSDGRSA
jgi:5-carboxymethyl-2-hydroxymuconate isomerase